MRLNSNASPQQNAIKNIIYYLCLKPTTLTKFRNKFRIESARLQNWDYGWKAKYFVTVVTKDRQHHLGKIIDGKIILSEIGKIVKHELVITPNIRADMNLNLDIFTVMPNHFHCIIEIDRNDYNRYENDLNSDYGCRDALQCVSNMQNKKYIPKWFEYIKPKNKFGPQSKNLGAILRGIKGTIKLQARKINPDFGWQTRFLDHIIRSETEYQSIKYYIINNPKNWFDDLFNNK